MKKFKLILCALVCVLGLTACGSEDKVLDPQVAAELEQRTAEITTNFLDAFDAEAAEELTSYGDEYMEYIMSNYFQYKANGYGLINAFTSWNSAKVDMGELVSISGATANYDDQGSDIIVTLDIVGSKRTAQIEAVYEDDLYHTLNSITTNINWTFGEKMAKAGLNTLMGMGTVFVVLILISLIISLFKFIPNIQAAFSKEKKDTKVEAVENTIAQIVEKEEQTDDLELIAVITAAIAASGTSGSSDDFIVRSIRRRPGSQWNKA